MQKINNHKAQTEQLDGSLIIIDVREPSEFQEHHIPGALNIPSTIYQKELFSAFKQLKIGIICQSGQRANTIGSKLKTDGFDQVFLLENQMQDIQKLTNSKGWSIDRQFRFLLGILLAISIALHFLNISSGIVIPIILSTGLIFTSLIDRCYLRMGIAMLPWNKGKKVPK